VLRRAEELAGHAIELGRVNKELEAFSYSVSHDLRAPLRHIAGFAGKLQNQLGEHISLDQEQGKVFIVDFFFRMSALIDDLLELARAEAGQVDLERTVVDVGEVAHEIAEEFQAQAASVGLELEVRVPNGVLAEADRMRTRQIIANLVSNAIKYAPGGPIVVSVKRVAGDAVLEVEDRGPGIQDADLSRIFGRFERAKSPAPAGLGLGLYIARQVAEAHGGTLTAETREEGGACFRLLLPLVAR